MPEYGDPLSEREIELLRLVATGVTNREIAYRLGISVNTVKVHVRNIFAKIGAESRTQATMIAVREGWIAVPATEAVAAPEAIPVAPPAVPPLPPLPWFRRVLLLVVFGLAGVGLALSWTRGAPTLRRAEADLPPERSQAGAVQVGLASGASRWRARALMPTPRAYLAAVTVGEYLLAIGGRTAEGVTGAVEIYDPQQDLWTRGADKPFPAAYIAAAALGDEVYVPGGCDAGFLPSATVEVYDAKANVWRVAHPMPAPRCAYALAAWDGQLYLFGGRDSRGYVGSVFVYDPVSDTWSESTPMQARAFAAAVVVEGGIAVIGGYDGRRELATCQLFDPTIHAWQECVPLTVGRGSLGLALLGGRLYAIGGGGWSSYLGFNEVFDPAQGDWSPLETPLVGEWRSPGVAVLDGSLYAVGGWSGGYLGLTEEYQLLPFRIFIPASQQD
jgi:DNA-binding CsgD family transcriptional regulator